MPPIHGRLTGGSLYNNRVLAYIEKHATVETYIDSTLDDALRWPGGIWLADSLCLDSCSRLLRQRGDSAGVLIAHYLKLLDPRHARSPQAHTELAALRAVNAVITTSEFSRRALLAAGYAGEVHAIPPGLDESYRSPLPLRPSRAARILTVATLLPDKGLTDLLSVLEDLRELEWSWDIVGETALDVDFARELDQRIRKSPIADRVRIRGALAPDMVLAAYDESDIFALPSYFETCSMATMEAMARALPVVAFSVGGLPDLFPEETRTLLPERGDLDAFSAALRVLIEDPVARRTFGDANRKAGPQRACGRPQDNQASSPRAPLRRELPRSLSFPSWEETGAAVLSVLTRLSPNPARPTAPDLAPSGNDESR